MQQRRQLGFTLIELMVTLLVAVVLISLAKPALSDLVDKSRLRGATDDIINLLNFARASAVKLQRDVNVSVESSGWCAGAASAATPAAGSPVVTAAVCDCAASTVDCTVGGETAIVTSGSYTFAGKSASLNVGSGSAILQGNGGVTFNSKFGALSLGAMPANPLITVTSPSGKFSTQISLAQLGQSHVCVPSTSPFVAGYPPC